MAHVPASPGARYGRSSGSGDKTAVQPGSQYSAATQYQPPTPYQPPTSHQPPRTRRDEGGWDSPTHTVSASYGPQAPISPKPRQRGVAGWQAVLLLIVIAGIGGGFDLATGSQVKGGFNIGVVVASVVAIIIVRHSSMFPVVVAPPLVYFAASAVLLYARSGGLHDRKVLLDAAANWLVYGFPAIAGATAAVLIIAGIRLFNGR